MNNLTRATFCAVVALFSLPLFLQHVQAQEDDADELVAIVRAIANTEIKAIVKSDKRKTHNRGYETFLFRRLDGEWKVVHTQSSSRAVVDESSHDHSESSD
ncbi:MAG: nuclear transport factor 2 family protein [Proteobacteria bacterium]|nr:nuclear transport factor 2 family protein [Pseudomonadota bacterium]